MKGLNVNKPASFAARKLEVSEAKLKEVVVAIVSKFSLLQKTNPMLAVEALFPFTSKELVESIHNNYQEIGSGMRTMELPNVADGIEFEEQYESQEEAEVI